MLEVFFDKSTSCQLKEYQAKGHVCGEIISFDDYLMIGDLNDIDKRVSQLKQLGFYEDYGIEFNREYYKNFITIISKAKDIRVWVGNSEIILLYFICYIFKYILHKEPNIYITVTNDMLIGITLLEKIPDCRKISIDYYASIYKKLMEENKPIRVVENDQVVSKDENYFDDKIRFYKQQYPTYNDDYICSLVLDDYIENNESAYCDFFIKDRIKKISK